MSLPTPTQVLHCPICFQGVLELRSATARVYQQPGALGVAILTTGEAGHAQYEQHPVRVTIADDVWDAGHDVITLQWNAPAGEFGGILEWMARLGYRHAYGHGWNSAFQFLRRQLTLPARVVAAGNSGGGIQSLYAAQEYGADHYLAGIVQSGGPPTFSVDPVTAPCIGGTETDFLLGLAAMTCQNDTLTAEEHTLYEAQLLNSGRLKFACPVRIVNSSGNSSDTNRGNAFITAVNAAGGNAQGFAISGSAHDVDRQPAGADEISQLIIGIIEA